MAESSCSVMSNSLNNQVCAVQRINQTEDKTEKVMEPMLLEDYKYGETPIVVTNLLDYFTRSKLAPDKNDIIVGFVYILMLECGFVDKNCTESVEDCDYNYGRLLRLSRTLPQGWKTHNRYKLDFILKSTPYHTCSITCVTISDDLLINCVIKDINTFSMILDPLTYFTSSNSPFHKFQNLKLLSKNFKDCVAIPAKIAIAGETSTPCGCLHYLPHELFVKIMTYVKISDVLNLAKTSRFFCQRVQDVTLWTKLLNLEFRKKHIFKTYDELKFLYEIKYARELTKILRGPYGN